MMKWVASAALLFLWAPAWAEDIAAGEQLAKTWCAGCHDIDSQKGVPRSDAIPSFGAVAHRPETSGPGLKAFLSTPHANMPDYSLTPRQIRDLTAYILSLRRPPASEISEPP